jgi:pyruvate/2-oxoglutarate dehydrogenase complex dihydrolipoamide dehydrogenase (E3) component
MPSREVSVSEHEFDVVVVGLGPGGEHVAGELAKAGLSVAGVEDRLVGGECPYWGCVPSKMMIRAADLLAEGRRIGGMAGSSVISPNWAPVAQRIRAEATDWWSDKAAADRFTGVGGTLFRGRGSIAGPGLVSVRGRVAGDTVLRARRGVVLDPGTAPAIPPISGLADTPYWTNREVIESEEVPHSLIVLGGGAIGSELAQVFARFGANVTVVEALAQLLPLEEPESGSLLAAVFKQEDIAVRTGVAAQSVSHQGGQFTVSLASGEELTGDRLLVATGRRADLAGLGIGAIGLDSSARVIETDEHLRAAPGVWAIGDVTGKGAFTHMSVYQAGIVIDDILGRPHHPAEYHAVPRVTFTDPEIGSVGLTEAQARAKYGGDVRTGTSQIPDSARGWIHKAGNEGFIKLVADGGRGVLVGATSAGPAGGEVLSMLTLAVHAVIPVQRLGEMIYAYPTFHRAVEDALSRLS